MKKYSILVTLVSIYLLTACDKVGEDSGVPVLNMNIVQSAIEEGGTWFALDNSPILVPIYGDFGLKEVTITSSNNTVAMIETEDSDEAQLVVFMEFAPNGSEVEFIDYELFLDGELFRQDTVEVRPYEQVSQSCDGAELADRHVVSQGGILTVDLLNNEVFCDAVVNSGGVRMFSISNDDDVLISLTPRTAVLTYAPPAGFTGQVQFIYELCYGFESQASHDGSIWEDPIEHCPYHYVALVTIDVVNETVVTP